MMTFQLAATSYECDVATRKVSGEYGATISSRLPTCSPNGPAWLEESTKIQPCQSTSGSSTRPSPDGSNPGELRKPGAPRSDPSRAYVHAWYGPTIAFLVAEPPHGRSSWQR